MPLKLAISTGGDYELHEADEWYDGHLERIEEGEGQWGPTFKFVILLDGEDDRETWAFCSQKLSPRSRLYGWAKALGFDMDSPYLDLEDAIGMPVQVMFERYEGLTPEGSPIEKEKVAKLRKGKGDKKKPARKPKVVDEFDDDEAPF